jgi:hypothetical protein
MWVGLISLSDDPGIDPLEDVDWTVLQAGASAIQMSKSTATCVPWIPWVSSVGSSPSVVHTLWSSWWSTSSRVRSNSGSIAIPSWTAGCQLNL